MIKLFNIPFAIGLTIDDMGWWLCRDDKEAGGPPRLHGTEDPRPVFYEKLIEMGKACGTRPQGSFIMSEFDRENICAKEKYNKPIAPINITEYGLNWTNEVSEEKSSVMNLIKEENAWLEFGLHGVRHGHFEKGNFYKSEWANRPLRDDKDKLITNQKNIEPWDAENKTSEVIADCFTELIRQYFTEEELSFPESFAPPHHVLYFDYNDYSTGAILSKRGVKYCNAKITGGIPLECPLPKDGVIDHGMHILDRRSLRGVPFDDSAHTPISAPRHFPWIETHFRDFWYTELKWAQYLYNINSHKHLVLAKNTEQVHSQFFYNKYGKIKNLPNKIIIDTNNIPCEVYENKLLSSLVIKVKLGKKEEISEVFSDNCSLIGYYKDIFGYAYLTIGGKIISEKGIYVLEYKTGKKTPDIYVDNSMSTYNLYDLNTDSSACKIQVKIYGEQTLRIKTPVPTNISGENINIIKTEYYENYLYVTVKAKSMNGTVGNIIFSI